MAMNILPAPMRPANPEGVVVALRGFIERALASPVPENDNLVPIARTPAMSKSTYRAVEMARLHLRHGNPAAYARALAGEHRAANTRQQRAIEAIIAADGMMRLFTRHPVNGCLIAQEG